MSSERIACASNPNSTLARRRAMAAAESSSAARLSLAVCLVMVHPTCGNRSFQRSGDSFRNLRGDEIAFDFLRLGVDAVFCVDGSVHDQAQCRKNHFLRVREIGSFERDLYQLGDCSDISEAFLR